MHPRSPRPMAVVCVALLTSALPVLALAAPATGVVSAPSAIGTISNYGRPIADPRFIATGPDGNLWFTDHDADAIGRITTAGIVSMFRGAGISGPLGIAAGPDGNLWFTNETGSSVGRITTSGVVSTFTGVGVSAPAGIAVGPDGNLWFTNQASNSIGRITTAGAISNFTVSTGVGMIAPFDIAASGNGAMFFTSPGNNRWGQVLMDGWTWTADFGTVMPRGMAADSTGMVWFANQGSNSVTRIDRYPHAGTQFSFPQIDAPYGITTTADRSAWFTNSGNDTIGRITTAGAFTSFSDPGISRPIGITAGPDGNVWFTNQGTNTIGRITAAGVVTIFDGGGSAVHAPVDIVRGADGNLWFTDGGTSSLVRMTTDGVTSAFPAPGDGAPAFLAAAPDGNLWFTRENSAVIGRMSPAGLISNFTVPVAGFSGSDITLGPDGNLWFTNWGTAPVVGRITPAGAITTFTDPGIDHGGEIVAGADGNLWFASWGNSRIGRVSPAGAITTFTDPALDLPFHLAAGVDGNVWFTNDGHPSLGRITPTGSVSILASPAIDHPTAVAPGPDGNMWFANTVDDTLVRITPGGATTAFSGHGTSRPGRLVAGSDGRMWFLNTGPSATSMSIGAIVAANVPGAPTGAFAVAGNGQVTVSWSAPASDGGGPITGYTVTAVPGSGTCHTTGALVCTIGGLSNGVAYAFTVHAANGAGAGPESDWSNVATPYVPGSRFHPVTPFRIEDSRPGPGQRGFAGAVGPGQVRAVTVAPNDAIPAAATGVVMNVTVTGGTAASYLTVYPSGGPPPDAANLVFAPGQTVPNLVTVGVGASGQVSFFNQLGSVHVVADVVGWFDDGAGAVGGLFNGMAPPQRLVDSRVTGNGTPSWDTAPLGENSTRDLGVAGRGDIPASAVAVVMNVTVTGGSKASFLQAFPSGAPRPITANLLFGSGQTVSNLVTVGVGAGGAVSLYNQLGSVNVIGDVVGYFDADSGSRFHALAPLRILDSRDVSGPSSQWNGQPLGPGASRELDVSILPGDELALPLDATGLVANLTVTAGTKASFVATSPAGGSGHPDTANVLFGAGQTVPNAVMVGIGPSNGVDVYNQLGSVHVVVDAAGYFAPL